MLCSPFSYNAISVVNAIFPFPNKYALKGGFNADPYIGVHVDLFNGPEYASKHGAASCGQRWEGAAKRL